MPTGIRRQFVDFTYDLMLLLVGRNVRGVVAQHVDNETPELLFVAMGEIDLGDSYLIVLIADNHRDTIGDLGGEGNARSEGA